MKYTYKSEQSGRSMVEMLGVLAIVGVLSVGGIAGYSKAMAKFKASKLTDQISMLVANIRTAFASQASYADLTDNTTAFNFGVVPAEMVVNGAAGTLTNAFGGTVTIANADSTGGAVDTNFTIAVTEISYESCMNIATSDWGEGLVSLAPNGQPAVTMADLPMSVADASGNDGCGGCRTTNTCSMIWQYN